MQCSPVPQSFVRLFFFFCSFSTCTNLATAGAAPLAVSNAATGAGTGAALLNSVGGLFVLLALLFGWRPRGLGGFGLVSL